MTSNMLILIENRLRELKDRRNAIRESYDDHRWPGDAKPEERQRYKQLGEQIQMLESELDHQIVAAVEREREERQAKGIS
jgi:hypothetical protein